MPATLKSRFPLIIKTLPHRMEMGTKQAAESIAERARERVPVDTGRLKSSIRVEPAEAEIGQGGYVVLADARDPETDYAYAVAIEFGGHAGQHGTGPHAFLLPAVEEVRPELVSITAAAMRGL